MSRRLTCTVLAGVIFFTCWGIAQAETISKIRVSNLSKSQYMDIVTLGLDIIETHQNALVLLANGDERQYLEQIKIPYQVEIEDMPGYYAARAAEPFGGFRTFAQIVSFIDSIAAAHPSIVSAKFSIGKTVENRDQWVFKISDNPGIDESEPEVFYNSLIHAREPASANALIAVIKELVDNYGSDTEITSIVDSRELFFLLVINPDGYVYNQTTNPNGGGLWRKNRRLLTGGNVGIDLNRNFSVAWGFDNLGSSNSLSSDTYRGASPFSEVETQHVRDFVASRNFVICNNIHTYSNLVLWPYGYDRIYSHREDFFQNLGDSLTQFNGYSPEIAWTLYPTNGAADDWMWGDTITKPRLVSITTEIGASSDGFWPSVARIPTLAAENVYPNIYLAKIADNPYVIGPPDPPTVAIADTVAAPYTVTMRTIDPNNPAVNYDLYELSGYQRVTDDAESDPGYWSTVRMTRTTGRKYAGNFSWGSQAINQANQWLQATTPFLVEPNDSLVFRLWYDVETDWDYFYAQVSTDGGYQYVNLANNLTTNVNPNGINLGNGITGASAGWVRAAFSLAPYVGQQVIIRLSYFTDNFSLNEGVYIDNIETVNKFQSEQLVASGITDTLYSFPTHTVGDYWYRAKARDTENQVGRYSLFEPTHVQQLFVRGDLDASGGIDLTDLQIMIDYLFFSASAPSPFEVGDINCDLAIDIGDLQLLIDYLFFGGTFPVC